jgi:hypothetical protein
MQRGVPQDFADACTGTIHCARAPAGTPRPSGVPTREGGLRAAGVINHARTRARPLRPQKRVGHPMQSTRVAGVPPDTNEGLHGYRGRTHTAARSR